MTQPPNDNDPYGAYGPGDGASDSDRTGGTGGSGGQDGPQYRPYPATPHPEDNPAGFNGYDGQPYGGAGYAGYGPQSGGQGADAAPGRRSMTRGTGRVDVMMAVRFAFQAVFANALVWLLGAFIFMVAIFGVSLGIGLVTGGGAAATGFGVADVVLAVVSMAVSVLIYNAALHQVDHPKIGFAALVRNVNFWPTIAVLVITGVVTSLISGLVTLAFVPELPTGPTAPVDPQQLLSFLGGMLGVALLMVVIAPLHTFMPWYAADRREGVVGAVTNGFKDGARNYLRLLAYLVISGVLLTLAAMVTLGIALIILAPALILSFAHLYRQMSQGQYPVA